MDWEEEQIQYCLEEGRLHGELAENGLLESFARELPDSTSVSETPKRDPQLHDTVSKRTLNHWQRLVDINAGIDNLVRSSGQRKVPKYVMIAEDIGRGTLTGTYSDAIPSEVNLMEEYQVSRSTVRRAMQLLAGEGAIIRKQGIGTFVNPEYHQKI